MKHITWITIELQRHIGKWCYQVRWSEADDRATVRWKHTGLTALQVSGDDLQEILEELAEDLYNLAPLMRQDRGDHGPAAPFGGSEKSTLPWT